MPQALNSWLGRVTGITDLPVELLHNIAANLPSIDRLALSHVNRPLNDFVQNTSELTASRARAVRVQAVWRLLTTPGSDGADLLTMLNGSQVVAALAPNFDCLQHHQHEHLVTAAEGLTHPYSRAGALAGFGPGLAALAPELHQRLVTAAEGLTDEGFRATALAGFGPGLAALAPELHQRLVTAAEGLTDEGPRATALAGFGPGLA
ncbi:F-box protein, partial [Achromobacter spanius]|uniref:F-box protein n=1 Tax=Achromobacter spanius TaxID=217203 RepID=UPI00380A3ED6